MKGNLGQYYDRSADFQKNQFDTLIRMIKEHVPCDNIKNVLEIGSGSGARTYELLNVFPTANINAVEPDFEMQSVAQKEYTDPRITYHQMLAEDILKLKEHIPQSDAVFCNWAIHWIKEKEKLFDDLEKMVSDDAYLMLSTCERLPQILVDIDEYVRSELLLPRSAEYPWSYLDAHQWREFLTRHGWKISEIKAYETPHFAEGAETYLEHWFAASTAKFLYGRQMEEFSDLSMADLTWYIDRKYADPDYEGKLSFTEDVVFMIAHK